LHDVLIAKNLLVNSANQAGLVFLGTDTPILFVAITTETLNSKVRGVEKGHGGLKKRETAPRRGRM
jgi:hypothetical protein